MDEKDIILSEREAYYVKCNMLLKWLELQRNKVSFKDYLNQKGYNTIAIYGIGILGQQLYESFLEEQIPIEYVMDRNRKIELKDLTIFSNDDERKKVDVIIVTPIMDYYDIKADITQFESEKIISLKTLIEDMYFECLISPYS